MFRAYYMRSSIHILILSVYRSDALDICARVISSLGGNKEDVLVQQALSLMDLTLSSYGEQAILLALFKARPLHSIICGIYLPLENSPEKARGGAPRGA